MDFQLRRKEHPVMTRYSKDDIELARTFANRMYKEFGNFLRAVVLFGSAAKPGVHRSESDIDMLCIVDDASIQMTPELAQTYRIITEKIIGQLSPRFHVTSIKLTSFWEYVRSGDPIGINILRDGIALIDTGLFDPLQVLLKQGRIRPTKESIYSYLIRAPNTLHNAKWHIMQATLDLYWAAIDAAHAALMTLGEIPPAPENVPELLRERMVKAGLLDHKYVKTMDRLYHLSRMIIHRETKEVSGEEFTHHYREAEEFVEVMRQFVEKHK
ncbi:nucleotidyltransferase domain-containing protein [Candidatus Woesearchaeota archaeon]|nr:nucleotidyltransferase domain-containing protein [Candidatus Woesearchaeota archaeon]